MKLHFWTWGDLIYNYRQRRTKTDEGHASKWKHHVRWAQSSLKTQVVRKRAVMTGGERQLANYQVNNHCFDGYSLQRKKLISLSGMLPAVSPNEHGTIARRVEQLDKNYAVHLRLGKDEITVDVVRQWDSIGKWLLSKDQPNVETGPN